MSDCERAYNGRDVGNGFDGIALRLGPGRILVGVYDLRTQAWEALGTFDDDDEEPCDLYDAARSVADCPGTWDGTLVWRESDPGVFKMLEKEFRAWEARGRGTAKRGARRVK